MRTPKSEIEEYYFNLFRTQYPLPVGTVIYRDKPDVFVCGEGTLGIEITNFYSDPTGVEQSQISMRLSAAKRAQKAYQDKSGKNIEYHFGFDRKVPIQKVTRMVKRLEILAERFEDRAIGQINKKYFSDVPEVSYVWRGGEYADCEWRVSQTFSTPVMDKNRLAEIIQEKSMKAKEYASCDGLWLLLVVEFMDLAQDQQIMNVPLDEIETDAFDKVLIYKTGIEEIREVPIRSTKLTGGKNVFRPSPSPSPSDAATPVPPTSSSHPSSG